MSPIVLNSKKQSFDKCKEEYKRLLLTFIQFKKGVFALDELTQMIKEAHEEFETKIIKGSKDEYEKYPLYPLLQNS